jgi:RimJ/RimL family protein N-acetyltransferase
MRLLGERLASDIPQVDAVVADVHDDNPSSLRMCEAAGYEIFGRDGPFVQLRFDVVAARSRGGDLETPR